VVSNSLSRSNGGIFDIARRTTQEMVRFPSVSGVAFGVLDEFSVLDRRAWSPVPCRLFPRLGPRALALCKGLPAALSEEATELVHAHGLWNYPQWSAIGWAYRQQRPALVSIHGMLDSWALANNGTPKSIATWAYQRNSLRKAACVHVNTAHELDSVRAYGLRNPVCIVPNGVDIPRSNGKAAGPWAGYIDPCERVLLYLGRVHPKKGLHNLIRAWADVQSADKRRSSGWVLAIAGWDQDGHRDELKRFATELNISFVECEAQKTGQILPLAHPPRLLFLGGQFGEAREACYGACDAFVLPSLSEGLPMVVLEAWAYGKPVLMTPECNLPIGFENSAAIDLGSGSKDLLNGLVTFFQMTDEERTAMGLKGLSLVRERFSWPSVAAELKQVYDFLLGGGPRPACLESSI
jgi:glycosyltransferase involved in cell wall biosynthesis